MLKTPTPRAAVAAHRKGDDRLFSRGGRGSGPALHRMGLAVSLAADGGDSLPGRGRFGDVADDGFGVGGWNGPCERGAAFAFVAA